LSSPKPTTRFACYTDNARLLHLFGTFAAAVSLSLAGKTDSPLRMYILLCDELSMPASDAIQ
jgi:hypothetical protein